MTEQELLISGALPEHPHVAQILLNRPPNNFLDIDLIQRLADALESLDEAGQCRAVVLSAVGRNFCAGVNFGDRKTSESDDPIGEFYAHAERIFFQPIPIVAGVGGSAVGGGMGLALAADVRVAGPSSRFAANFSRLGFHHGFGLSLTLPNAVGRARATEILMSGRMLYADEALSSGLVTSIANDENILDSATELAIGIAEAAPLAVRSIRMTMRSRFLEDLKDAMTHEKAEQYRLQGTADFRAGIRASLKREVPVFIGS